MSIPEPKVAEDGKFQCPVCGKTFRTRELYDSHIRTNHPQNIQTTWQTTDWTHQEQRMEQIEKDEESRR